MNNVEELLRDALDAEADRFEPSPDLWRNITAATGRKRWKSWAMLPLSVAAATVVVLGTVALLQGEDDEPTEVVTLTTPPLPGTSTVPVSVAVDCPDIAFAPNSDNMATRIKATGIGCEEASAFVRRTATTHNFYSGPRTFEQDGFTCRVVTEEDELPEGHYTCTSGAALITWVKT